MDRFANSISPPGLNQAQRQTTPFDTVTDTLQDAMSLAMRVQALAEHLLGGFPTGAESGQVKDTPSGCLYRLADHAGTTQQVVKAAHDALSRIEAVLP